MDSKITLYRRDAGSSVTIDLIITLLVLLIVSIACVGALWLLRRKRRSRKAALLPMHSDSNEKLATPKKMGHRRLSGITVSTGAPLTGDRRASSKFVNDEKQRFMATTSPPPSATTVPEIRITFPDETDTTGKRQSGRSVLIHVDDKGGIGMEPVHEDESLPPYQAERFVSLDLDRMGGLKEKDHTSTTTQATTA